MKLKFLIEFLSRTRYPANNFHSLLMVYDAWEGHRSKVYMSASQPPPALPPKHAVPRMRQLEYRLLTKDERKVPYTLAESVPELCSGETTRVVIAHVNDLNSFYIVRESDEPYIRKINEDLSQVATFGLPPYHPMQNEIPIAVAQFHTRKWVRIRILKLETREGRSIPDVHVSLMDSGETAVLSPNEIREIPSWALTRPPGAIHCSLGLTPKDFIYKGKQEASSTAWAEQIVLSLSKLGKYETAAELTAFRGLEARLIHKDGDVNYIDLKLRGKETSFSNMLVDSGIANWISKEFKEDAEAARATWKGTFI